MFSFYLIHGTDILRKYFMEKEFTICGLHDVHWVTKYNKDTLDNKFINKIYSKSNSFKLLKKGEISCTFKHYTALKHFLSTDKPYAVIMEDNILFQDNILVNIHEYIDEAKRRNIEWDFIFEGDTLDYIENPVTTENKLYLKNPNVTNQCHGGTNAANFYIVKKESVRKFIDSFIPFDKPPDHYYNDIIRKFKLKSYWVVPNCVHRIRRKSTVEYD